MNGNNFDCVIAFSLLGDSSEAYVQLVIFNIVELINIKSSKAIVGIVLLVESGIIVVRLKIQDLSIELFLVIRY